MTTFDLLALLPTFLTIKYRGRIYPNMTPAFIQNGSRINLCYVCTGKTVVFYERIDDQEELEDFVKTLAAELEGVEVFQARKMFS